ncbi:hypothetical protein I5E68_01190 [Novosphingobium sp. YJ-S2-02]|uniref:Uncharacterized protein n=1 Tax=Novosphingobium aureum TaxID=2792964 RepID=A0A931MJI5_9SPHN|nr:hypothetical protein [Novosphingobium aureum]MBH0111565.1 hypothetical protein [Novosphingobium aureum]
MVDILALALSHGLLALAVWRLLSRDDLDVESLVGTGPSDEAQARGANEADGSGKPAPRRAMRTRSAASRRMIVPGRPDGEAPPHGKGDDA